MPKIRGRIIRIIDTRTVIVNLGSEHGIEPDSVFSILGGPEGIVDPVTHEELGAVLIVKGRVRASQVFDKFCVASTRWTETRMGYTTGWVGNLVGYQEHDEELLVLGQDLQPWKALTEDPVRVGDEVEVEVAERPEGRAEDEQESGEESVGSPHPGNVAGDSLAEPAGTEPEDRS